MVQTRALLEAQSFREGKRLISGWKRAMPMEVKSHIHVENHSVLSGGAGHDVFAFWKKNAELGDLAALIIIQRFIDFSVEPFFLFSF